MDHEIVFTDKLLWSALTGLLAGAYVLGAGEGWTLALIAAVGAGVLLVVALTYVLIPAARYLILRNLEGQSRTVALMTLALRIFLPWVLVAAIAWVIGMDGLRAVFSFKRDVEQWLREHTESSIWTVLSLMFFAFMIYEVIKRRIERNKMKVVDLSRSRDIQLK